MELRMESPWNWWMLHPLKNLNILNPQSDQEGLEMFGSDTLPETNIASENRPLEKEIPIGNHHF